MLSIKEIFVVILGLGWTLGVGQLGTSLIVNKLWNPLEKQDNSIRPYAYTAIFVGLVERALYFFSILLGYEEFVAVWLALKVAGSWKRWEEGVKEKPSMKDIGRVFYNIFLIGSGLSLGFSFMGVNLVLLINQKEFKASIIAVFLFILGCILFYFIIQKEQEKAKNQDVKSGQTENTSDGKKD